MFRLVSRQAFKPVDVHYYRLQVHHPRRAISTTPRCNTDDSFNHDGHHNTNSGGLAEFAAGSKPGSSFVTWSNFSQLDKDVSNVKLKLDHLESGQKEMKSEIKDLGSRLDKDIKDLSNRMDRKFEKTDSKIDRVLYGIITGLVGFVLKGGFDYYQDHKKCGHGTGIDKQ